MKGLANIPILIALALIIAITPFAINQVQKSQILQNRASGEVAPYLNQVPCADILSAQKSYCSTNVQKSGPSVPCSELTSALMVYCYAKQPTPVPTTNITKTPTKPIPTPIATTCTTGHTKCVGRMIFSCNKNTWGYSAVCQDGCVNGKCVTRSIN